MYKMESTANAAGKAEENDVTERVRDFYEHFQFPGTRPPDQDGLILMRRFVKRVSQYFENTESEPMRVLDAGCGTGNTTISLARRFPKVDFLGLDLSAPSLESAKEISIKEHVKNIQFHQWDLMKPRAEKMRFDIVLCLGVLHHTANMHTVLSNLRNVLKNDGELYLWVYGRHGRYRHSLNQRLLHMLLNSRPESTNRVQLAKEFLFGTKDKSILNDLLSQSLSESMHRKVLEDPTWIADQFLHPNEISLDMETLISMTIASGFEIDQWLGIKEDVSSYVDSAELIECFERLPRNQRLIALDLLLKVDHYFIVIRKAQK